LLKGLAQGSDLNLPQSSALNESKKPVLYIL
jgi:hypothetical protein